MRKDNNYVYGDYNAMCDVCSFQFKASQLRKMWDGAMACKDCWEPRHPADRPNKPSLPRKLPFVRPEQDPVFMVTTPFSGSLIDTSYKQPPAPIRTGTGSGSVTRANLKLSAADGVAFVDFGVKEALIGFPGYEGAQLTLSDSTGKKLVGYIKAAGTGETYGSELLTNGDMEAGDPPTGWSAVASSVLSSVTDNRPGSAGTKAINIARGTSNQAGYQALSVSTGACVRANGWRRSIDGTASLYLFLAVLDYTGGSSTSWNTQTLYAVATNAHFTLLATGTAGQACRYDDISVKQVVTPSATGVTITSTPNGSTQSWASQESGFNYNDASGYTYSYEATY